MEERPVKHSLSLCCCFAVALALLFGCRGESPTPTPDGSKSESAAQSETPSTPSGMTTDAPGSPPAGNLAMSGKVIETMNTGGYTYVHVDTGSNKIWAAAPQFQVKVGDDVVVPQGMLMSNHHSKTLDRTFDSIYFVGSVQVGAGSAAGGATLPPTHPGMGGSAAAPATDVDLSGIAKADDGYTIAEIFAQKSELSGKPVTLRGKVVKFTADIMNKNWVHIQDGTGEFGANDLTVTTAATVKVGDTVLVGGTLTTDKDFGYGYQYAVLIEDAEFTV
jgi:hypothetical protein